MLSCPDIHTERYSSLKTQVTTSEGERKRRFFFALNLYQCADLLPRLLGSIVEAVRFLGPANCALSIVEGRSEDGTYEILLGLMREFDKMGLQYYLNTSVIDPRAEGMNRVEGLSALRNLALRPLIDHQHHFVEDATVAFINDVAACPDDILELIYQRFHQHADMTCAMDWLFLDPEVRFYDTWIARTVSGDTFLDIPLPAVDAFKLFWNDDAARSRMEAGQPFQVFSCWNGAVAFTAKPVVSGMMAFRRNYEDECYQGEPTLWCKDLWLNGLGKIAVVPSVHLGYNDREGDAIKEAKGYVQNHTAKEDGSETKIRWQMDPPEMVKCLPNGDDPSWMPWNEGIPSRN
jgi:alpha-1,3-mannosyltransferase